MRVCFGWRDVSTSIEPLFETNKIVDGDFEDRVRSTSRHCPYSLWCFSVSCLFDSNKNLYRVELHSSERVWGNSLTDLNPRRCKIYLEQIKNMSLRREFHVARSCSNFFRVNYLIQIKLASFDFHLSEVRLEEIADIRFARIVVKFIWFK